MSQALGCGEASLGWTLCQSPGAMPGSQKCGWRAESRALGLRGPRGTGSRAGEGCVPSRPEDL